MLHVAGHHIWCVRRQRISSTGGVLISKGCFVRWDWWEMGKSRIFFPCFFTLKTPDLLETDGNNAYDIESALACCE